MYLQRCGEIQQTTPPICLFEERSACGNSVPTMSNIRHARRQLRNRVCQGAGNTAGASAGVGGRSGSCSRAGALSPPWGPVGRRRCGLGVGTAAPMPRWRNLGATIAKTGVSTTHPPPKNRSWRDLRGRRRPARPRKLENAPRTAKTPRPGPRQFRQVGRCGKKARPRQPAPLSGNGEDLSPGRVGGRRIAATTTHSTRRRR